MDTVPTATASIAECSMDEFRVFWGIIIFAGKVKCGGVSKMFNDKNTIVEGLPTVDLLTHMKQYRFKQLIKYVHFSFAGDNDDDPWNPTRGFLDGFNRNRRDVVASKEVKTLDESMSSWSPTTTQTGKLPHFSFIAHKPKPPGSEANGARYRNK